MLTSVKHKWFLKSLAVFGVLFYSLFIGSAISSYAGWPTDEKLEDGELQWVVVVPPFNNSPGAIYIWATPKQTTNTIFGHSKNNNEPRAHVIPYSHQMHEKANKAMQARMKGKRIKIKSNGETDEGIGKGDKNAGGSNKPKGRGLGHGGVNGIEQDFEFYEFPTIELPSKDMDR
jgi:hypothetical protein